MSDQTKEMTSSNSGDQSGNKSDNDLSDPAYRQFVQNIIDNIKKNGFPDKRVAFGLEKLYEAAEKKHMNLNKVLQTLEDIQIAHEKTPDKIIFFPKATQPIPPVQHPVSDNIDSGMFAGLDPSLFAGMDPSMFEGIDFTNIKNMSLPQMMAMVGKLMKNMTPDQLRSIKNMYDNMTEEQKSSLVDKAKDFGILKKDDPKND